MEQMQLLTEAGWLRLDLLGRLLLATVIGGLIGWEREYSGKPAGLRTNLLICVGAALLADLSVYFAGLSGGGQIRADPARIAAQIVSGIGFLGAGTIIQARGSVTGLTTAATLWVVAAIGMAVGSGAYVAAVGTAVLVLLALTPLAWLEEWIRNHRSLRSGTVVASLEGEPVKRLREAMESRGLTPRLTVTEADRAEGTVSIRFDARGRREAFDELQQALVDDGTVRSFRVSEAD